MWSSVFLTVRGFTTRACRPLFFFYRARARVLDERSRRRVCNTVCKCNLLFGQWYRYPGILFAVVAAHVRPLVLGVRHFVKICVVFWVFFLSVCEWFPSRVEGRRRRPQRRLASYELGRKGPLARVLSHLPRGVDHGLVIERRDLWDSDAARRHGYRGGHHGGYPLAGSW